MSTAETKAKGAKLGADEDVNFFKCIIKALMKDKEGKPRTIPWEEVAGYMQTGLKADSLRKRFDKVKKEINSIRNDIEGEATGDADAASVKKPAVKRAPAKDKTSKATGKGKAKKEETDNEERDEHLENSGSQESDGAKTTATDTIPEGHNVEKVAKRRGPRKSKAVEAKATKLEEEITKKRARVEEDGSEGTSGDDELSSKSLLTPPKRARSTKTEVTTAIPVAEVEAEQA